MLLNSLRRLKNHFIKREVKPHKTLWWDDSTVYYYYNYPAKSSGCSTSAACFILTWARITPQKTAPDFYCMANPTFYSEKGKIAEIISDERGALLYITETEKNRLEKQGLKLQPVPNQ